MFFEIWCLGIISFNFVNKQEKHDYKPWEHEIRECKKFPPQFEAWVIDFSLNIFAKFIEFSNKKLFKPATSCVTD